MEVKEPSRIGSNTAAVHIGPAEGWTIRMAGLLIVTRKVSGEQTGGAYSLFEAEVGPGGGEGPHIQHREDECFYVIEGRFGFAVEGEEIEAGPGSIVYVPKGNLHAFENVGERAGRMLVSQTPGGAYEGFVEKVGQPIANGSIPPEEEAPDDAGRIAAVGAEYGVEMVPSLP